MLDLKTASEGFLKWLKVLNHAQATLQHYVSLFKEFGIFLERKGIKDLRAITKETLEEFKQEIFSHVLADSTKAKKINRLGKFFGCLTKSHSFLWDPGEVLKVKNPRSHSPKIKDVLSVEEVDRLIEAAGRRRVYPRGSFLFLRDRALLELIYSTGLRLSEATTLKVDDVDLKNGFVFVREGKGGRDRMVPMGTYAINAIKDYLEQLRPQLACCRTSSLKELFLTHHGEVLDKGDLGKRMKYYARRAGIKKSVYPHLLRHTFATHLLEAGAPLVVVKELLGHVCVKNTQIYTHVAFKELRKTYLKYHPRGKRFPGSEPRNLGA